MEEKYILQKFNEEGKFDGELIFTPPPHKLISEYM
jgi:hypothetical protein